MHCNFNLAQAAQPKIGLGAEKIAALPLLLCSCYTLPRRLCVRCVNALCAEKNTAYACNVKLALESRLLRTRSNRSRRYQTMIKRHRIASSPTHLVLQAYCLTDLSKFGTEQQDVFRYSMVSRQFGRCPKKHQTRYPALLLHQNFCKWLMHRS